MKRGRMMYKTDNPVWDAERYMQECEESLNHLPTCENCGESIQQEDAVHIDGYWYCDDCLKSFRKEVS